jgi:hypothetical protein
MATTNVVSSGLATIAPEVAPYYTGVGKAGEEGYIPGLLPTAQGIYAQDYATQVGAPLEASGLGGAGRIAGLSDIETKVGADLMGLKTPEQFGMGTNAVQSGISTLQGMTDPSQTQAFMSPYIQNVMDVNKAEAMRDAQRQLLSTNLAAGRKGSYGTSGNILAQTEQERNFQTKLGGIQATGMQNAFEAAQRAQLASAQGYNQLAGTSGQLGTQQQATDLSRLGAQSAQGGLERSIEQQGIDASYADLMREINYEKEQIGGMQGVLTGVPTASMLESKTSTTPSPSLASQLTGAGVTGLSLYQLFNK